MTDKFYLGTQEVSRDEYEARKKEELAAGHGIKSSEEVGGYPEYTLDNGTIIRGDKEGFFNRVEDGQLMEIWMPGTVNVWVQQEQTDDGHADFFFKDPDAKQKMREQE